MLHGPWDERRADYLAALAPQAMLATVGAAVPLDKCMIDWNPPAPLVLPWEDAARIMAAKCRR